jgi:large subunit ribosomal protein L49
MALQSSSRSLYRSIWTSQSRACQRQHFSTSIPRYIETIQVETTAPSEAALSSPAVASQPQTTSSQTANTLDSSSTLSEPTFSSSRLPHDTSRTSSLLPYHVSRTPSNNLPVYTDIRNGKTRKETIIRKITGDPRPLRDAVRELLQVDTDRVWVGKVTGHVYVKGHHKPAIEKFLSGKGF